MPRVTRSNAHQHLQNALDTFVKVTNETIGVIFTWDGKINVIGTEAFKEFAVRNQSEVSKTLMSSLQKRFTRSKPEKDLEMLELLKGDFSKLNVFMLRRMVGWLTQRAIGRRRNFWGKENLMPKWWPKKHPFSNVRNSHRKLLLSILEAYKSRESVNPGSDPRDRSPIASPKRSSHLDDDVFTWDHEYVLSQATLERIDLEFYDNDPPSFFEQNSGDILPPSNPESFFPYIPDTPVSIRRTQAPIIIAQPDYTPPPPEIAVSIDHATVEPIVDNIFPRRIIPNGDMQIALHELSHENTFLTDITMNAFSVLLLNQFPNIQGMQDTIMSQGRHFVPALPGSFQIQHDGGLHWIVSRIDANRIVYLHDSMYYGYISNNTKVQLASLYRKEAPEDLEVRVVPIQQQQGGSDCGIFAAAVCVILAKGGDPSKVRWRQNRMRKHLKDCFETGCIMPFPNIPAIHRSKVQTTSIIIPLICICRLPEYAFNKKMKCVCCSAEYHNSCMGYSYVRRGPQTFTCFGCKPQPSQVKFSQAK